MLPPGDNGWIRLMMRSWPWAPVPLCSCLRGRRGQFTIQAPSSTSSWPSRTIHDPSAQLNFILLSPVAVCPLVCSSIGYMLSACIPCWCVCNAVCRYGSSVILFRAAHAATKITVGRGRWWGLHKFSVPIKMISLSLRRHWTSHGWEDPLEAPSLVPCHGTAGEDCAEAFADEGFTAWYLDQE